MMPEEETECDPNRKRCAILVVVSILLAGIIFAGINIKIFGFRHSVFGYFVVGLLGVCALGLVLGLMYCCFKLNRSMKTTTHTRARRLDERNGSSRPFSKQVDYLDDTNVETTYKLQNDVNMTTSMNSNQSAHGSGGTSFLSGARPKNSAARPSGGNFQNSSASFRAFQNHPSPLLGRCSQPNPSPPSYRDALERGCVEHPTGNNAYPNRNNDHLWLQRKRVNDDSVEFTV